MRNRHVKVHMAHMPGLCAMAQTPNGQHLFTSGIDATLRLHDIDSTSSGTTSSSWWRSEDPREPEMSDLSVSDAHEKAVTALVVTAAGTTLASACEDGFVRFFSLSSSSSSQQPKVTFLQSCARFSAPVRTLSFSGSGSFVAAAGEEPGLIKVIMTAQPASVNLMRAPTGSPAHDAIVDLAFDNAGDIVASVGERGTAAVWDVEQSALLSIVDLNGRSATSVEWTPDGSALIFGTDKGAVYVSRMRWFVDFQLEDVTDGDGDDDDADDIFSSSAGKKHVTSISWSANGRYVLTATKDCGISLWDVHAKKVLGAWKAEHEAQHVQWHVKDNSFIIVDAIGQWGIVGDVVPSHMPSPLSSVPLIDLPSIPTNSVKKKHGKKRSDNKDEDDNDGDVKRSKTAKERRDKIIEKKRKSKEAKEKHEQKKKLAATGGASNIDDDAGEDADADGADQEMENGFSLSDVDADDEEAVEDSQSLGSGDSDYESSDDEEVPGELAGLENGGVHLPELKRRRKSQGNGDVKITGHGSSNNGSLIGHIGGPSQALYESFMPSSTPLSEKSNKKSRILVWNLVGAVLSFDENTHDVVEVEFSDATKRTVGIKDHYGYTVGCLTETGVFLGSPKTKEHGSVVTFRPFSSWASNSDWTQFMPENEDLSVIALGQRFAAVATTPNNLIRIFSLSGIQTAAYGIGGNVVTMSAMGDFLAVVYNESCTGALRVEVIELSAIGETEKVLYDGTLQVSGSNSSGETSTLEWIGFTSDTQDLVTYDSNGWVWMLMDIRKTRRWIPVVQNAARTAECDWFWAAAVTSEKFVGAACLSNERYPSAKPRPGLRSIVLSAPVIDRVSKNGKPTLMERHARTRLKLQRLMMKRSLIEELMEDDDEDDEELEEADDAVSRMELEADKCVLALMEDACRKEQNMRALDLSTRLNCKISFKYAIELAQHFKRTALVSRVEHVAAQKIAVIDDEARAKETRRHRQQHEQMPSSYASHDVGTSPVSMQNGYGTPGATSKIGTPRKSPRDIEKNGGTTSMHPLLLSDEEDKGQSRDLTTSTKEDDGRKRTKPKRNLNSALKETKKKQESEELRVTDVTDDEEEVEMKKESEPKDKKGKAMTSMTTATTSTKTSKTAKQQSSNASSGNKRGQKRRASTTTTTTTTKTEIATNAEKSEASDASKKARVEIPEQAAPRVSTNPRFTSFKNRFLKK